MNRNFNLSAFSALSAVAAVFAIAASGNAFADDITAETTPFVSTRSIAEVQAELVQYKKTGINPWSFRYDPLASFKSTLSSEQVTAAYIASRSEVAAFNGEDSGSAYLAATRGQEAGATLAGWPRNVAR